MPKPVILCADDESVVLNSLKIQLRNKFKDAFIYEIAESADRAAIDRAKREANLHSYLSKPWLGKEVIETIKDGLKKI